MKESTDFGAMLDAHSGRFRASELRLFWCCVSEFRHALRDPTTEPFEIDMLVDELEGFKRNTDNERIRRACEKLLTNRPQTPRPRPVLTVF